MFKLPDFEKLKPKKLKEATEVMDKKLGITVRDSVMAFENAIEQGMERMEEYMYMYTVSGKDFFKNIDTREYIYFEIKEFENEKI